VLLPVVLSSLVATQERAMALEVRGFGLPGPRVPRYVVPDSVFQRALRWILGLLVLLALTARVAGWR
jgi:energy-coupling factor transporter transmembrane protein EcfT